MPSGKARFGGRLIDVIARGEAIDRGTQVVVVEVRGNHLLVQAAPPQSPRHNLGPSCATVS